MPFTPSHVAAALPFLRAPLLPAAVVVGTVMPDIPYYVPLFVPRDLSHSPFGAVTIDLAFALAVVLLWWCVLREPLVDLLPRWVGVRIPVVTRTGWRPRGWGWPLTIVLLIASALVGIATHLAWDSFTHPGWVVDHLPLLRVQLGPLPVEKWLQHLSSVVGLVIVTIWTVLWARRTTVDPDRPSRLTTRGRALGQTAFLVAGIVSALVVWIAGIAGGAAAFDPSLVFRVARVGIGMAIAAALVLVVIWLLAGRSLRPQPGSGASVTE